MQPKLSIGAIGFVLVACAPATAPRPSSEPANRPIAPPKPPEVDAHSVEVEAKVREIVRPILAEGAERAVGVVVLEDDKTRVLGFGRRNSTDPRAPDGKTRFEIGSIAKGFAGIVLADAVLRGELSASDPLRKYLPPELELTFTPTLEHVATLSSGFPWMPTNWIGLDPVTHRTRYSVDDFRKFLRDSAPSSPPGDHFSYSNVDTALLAMALSGRYGMPYPELLRTRLFAPLEMTSSEYASHPPSDPNRLDGYDDENRLRPPRLDVSPLAPCCAIRSTLDDMARFMRGVMPSQATALSKAFWLASRPRIPTGANLDRFMGFGWVSDSRYGDVSKNGQVEGYRSVLELFPEQRRGVFVVVNSEKVDVDTLGSKIVETLFAPRPNGVGAHANQIVRELPADTTRAHVTFSDAIALEGWLAPACVKPNQKLRVTYYYRALTKIDRDWQIFVHGDASKPGVARLHGDHYPGRSHDTTLDWQAGELVFDEIELDVPSGYGAGAFTIWTGWYRGSQRMSAVGENVANDRAKGPTIAVGACP